MNPNIRALAHDAGLYVDLGHTLYPRAMSAEECEAAYAKFAESLIRECANRMGEEIVYNNAYKERNKAISDMIEVVKQHFGVEE